MSTKVHVVKAMVFPVFMYGCESWTIKKAESQRIHTLKLWGAGEDFWESLRLVRKSNLSILKEISPEYSLEELMLRLQYFGHLMWRVDLFEKTLMLRKIEARRRRGWQRHHWMASLTQWTWVWANSGVGDGQARLACCSPWGCKELDVTEQLNNNNNEMSKIGKSIETENRLVVARD